MQLEFFYNYIIHYADIINLLQNKLLLRKNRRLKYLKLEELKLQRRDKFDMRSNANIDLIYLLAIERLSVISFPLIKYYVFRQTKISTRKTIKNENTKQ